MTATLLTARPALPVVRRPPRRVGTAASVSARKGRVETERTGPDLVEIWGRDSFPASDPPANW